MVFMTDNMVKTDNCRKVFAKGNVMSATIMDARVATIEKSVTKKMVKRDEWGLNLREKSYQSGVFILEILKNALGSNPCEKMHYCAFRFESLRSHNQERTNNNRAKTKACLGKSLVSREYEGTKFY